MSSKASKKSKKPVETTLGKGKTSKPQEEIDISNVRKPIDTSVSGLLQALSLLDTATEEVKNYVMYECDIMYECKLCRNIFRSLANFILHKRNFCKDRFNPLDRLNNNGYQEVVYPLPDSSIQNDKCSSTSTVKQKKSLNPVIDKLLEKHKIEQFCKEVISENLANLEKNRPLDKPVKNMDDCEIELGDASSIILERIDSNTSAVFQTFVRHTSDESVTSNSLDLTEKPNVTESSVTGNQKDKENNEKLQQAERDRIKLHKAESEAVLNVDNHNNSKDNSKSRDLSMKAQIMEIHGILENDKIVVGSDGKLKGYYKGQKAEEQNIFPKSYLVCTECNVRFTTKKTLAMHIRTRHNSSAKVYICPNCKELLASPWSVVRHLIKVHRMSEKQVRQMRDKIHNSWLTQEDAALMEKRKKPGESTNEDAPTDSENQWINNIEEDNDLQMCAGCGKRFERRAALHSHSVMCVKRIAVCANIKENNAKKKEEEEALEKARQRQALDALKGASKRKGSVVRRRTERTITIEESATYSGEEENITPIDNLVNESVITTPTREICIALPRQRVEDMEKQFKNELLANILKDTELKSLSEECLDTLDEQNKSEEILNTNTTLNCDKEEVTVQNWCENFSDTNTASPSITKTENKIPSTPEFLNIIRLMKETGVCNKLSTDEKKLTTKTIPVKRNIMKNSERKPTKDRRNTKVKVKKVHPRGLVFSSDVSSTENYFNKIDKSSVLKQQPNKIIKRKSGFRDDINIVKEKLRKRNSASLDALQSDEGIGNESSNSNEEIDLDFNIGGLDPENGFAGFSKEEITNRYGIKDLSTLSYNNPLRRLQNLKNNEKAVRQRKRPLKVRTKKQRLAKQIKENSFDLDDDESLNLNDQHELSFINKASPYMDQDSLLCTTCCIKFDTFALLLWHMSVHFSWFRFQCGKCSFISFNKLDCINHVKDEHRLTTDSGISSAVLPVPNWKTILLSHEFRPLKHCDNLKGKHTDETILIEENVSNSGAEVGTTESNDSFSEDLFSECDKKSSDSCVTVITPSDNRTEEKISDIIDISEQSDDMEKINEPEELVFMPADISEVFDNFKYKEYVPFEERTPVCPELLDDSSSNDTDFCSEIFKIIEMQKPRTDQINSPEKNIHSENLFGKISPTMGIRPSRIRTKVKLHEDFVYYNVSSMQKICESSTKISNLKSTEVVSTALALNKK